MSSPLNITESSFKSEVLQSDKLVLVDFWAPWCGPCKQLSPILDKLAVDMEKDLKIVKVNIDENQDLPSKLGVRSIPTILLFKVESNTVENGTLKTGEDFIFEFNQDKTGKAVFTDHNSQVKSKIFETKVGSTSYEDLVKWIKGSLIA